MALASPPVSPAISGATSRPAGARWQEASLGRMGNGNLSLWHHLIACPTRVATPPTPSHALAVRHVVWAQDPMAIARSGKASAKSEGCARGLRASESFGPQDHGVRRPFAPMRRELHVSPKKRYPSLYSALSLLVRMYH